MAGEKDDDDDILNDMEIDGDNGQVPEDSLDLNAEDLPDDADDTGEAIEDAPDGAGDDDQDEDAPRRRNKLTAKERIAKAVRKQKEAERALDAERQSKAELEKQLHESRTYVVKGTAASLTAQADKVRAELKQAIEDGDTDRQLQLNEELMDLRMKVQQASNAASRMERETPAAKQPAGEAEFDGPITDAPPAVKEKVYSKMNPLARKWAKDHSLLDQSPEVIGITVSVEASVMADGYDKASPEYYAELDKRLKRRAPELYEDQDEGETRPRPRISSPVAGAPRRVQAGQRPAGKAHLTADQVTNMRKFGLDPANPAHRAEYAKNASR